MHAHGCTRSNRILSHTYAKHIPSQICIFLIPSTLLRLLLLSSLCLSGVIVSILLHQGAPEGYKLNINANALSHCPPPPPSSCTHTHTHTPILAIQTDQCVCELIGEQWAFFNEREREIRVAKPQSAHPEPQPRQRLEKPGAIIEYANARGPLTVSLSVALDEIRAEALIWDADGSQNRHVHKVQRAGRVWMRLVLIRKGAHNR